jgi:hypothetical protein
LLALAAHSHARGKVANMRSLFGVVAKLATFKNLYVWSVGQSIQLFE